MTLSATSIAVGTAKFHVVQQMALRSIRSIQDKATTMICRNFFSARGAKLGRDIVFSGVPRIGNANLGTIHIGDRCILVSNNHGTVLGVSKPSILRLLDLDAKIIVGADTGLSGTTICAAISVQIGERCLLGADTVIFDTDFHPLEIEGRRYARPDWKTISSPVCIGDDVFLGARTMVMKGVTIGAGSVIGASSVVVSDIPAGVVAAGNPARILRKITPGD